MEMDSAKIKKAQMLAGEYQDLLKRWIPRRRVTIQELLNIADSIKNIEFRAGVGKVVGATIAVLGGIVSVGSIFVTGGLATPLIVGGLIGSMAGTATSVGSDIVGDHLSINKMEEAQKELEREKELVVEIEKKKVELDAIVEEVSQSTGISAQQVLSALLMTSVPGYCNGPGYTPSIPAISPKLQMALFASLILGNMTVKGVLTHSASPLGKAMEKILAGVSVKGFSRIAGVTLKCVTAGALLVLDIYVLVKTAVDINNGSGSKAAKALKGLAAKLENQTKDVETLLEEIKTKAEDVGKLVRDKFRQLLITISQKGEATDAEAEEVLRWIESYACKEWKERFLNSLDLDTFALNKAFPLARVFDNLRSAINEYLGNEDEKNKEGELVITVIAHGSINTAMQFPSMFYYMTPSLASVTLYVPWGCAVDATVVHGICTNTINIGNARYSDEVFPSKPIDFNKLPRAMVTIPTVTFSPVKVGEAAHVALEKLFQIFTECNPNGILIKYFVGEGKNQLPYPEVPLWLFAAAVSICSVLLCRKIHIQVAACLSVSDPGRETGFVNCRQYCVVDGTKVPAVIMTKFNDGSKLPNMEQQFAALNEVL